MKPQYILAAAAAATTVLALAATPAPLPPNWSMMGQNPDKFTAGVDPSPEGHGAKFLRNKSGDGAAWASLGQSVLAQRYVGQRVRFRARLRTQDPSSWAALWMSINTREGSTVAFSNTQDNPVKGSAGWQERSIVLDVPADAGVITFGMIGAGTGQAWMEPLAFETVGRDVPVDRMPPQPGLPTTPTL
ncbi:MAG: transcriptional regulator [Massilia sp.]|nr:transcriptional regulator [Massilia sp.]